MFWTKNNISRGRFCCSSAAFLLAGGQFVLAFQLLQSSTSPMTGSENNNRKQMLSLSILGFRKHSAQDYTFLSKSRNIALCERGNNNKNDNSENGFSITKESFLSSPSPSSLQELIDGLNYDGHCDNEKENKRTRQTVADQYYDKHGCIPRPKIMHDILSHDQLDFNIKDAKGILVIGDVHGCLEELLLLYNKAVKENDNCKFKCVILVGDLSNKGKFSAATIRFVRKQKHWFAIRGNHDEGALNAALGDSLRRKKKTYQWVMEGEDILHKKKESNLNSNDGGDKEVKTTITLSDNDVIWLSELPYTITIPASLLVDNKSDNTSSSTNSKDMVDTVIVHAGLIPGVSLEDQIIETMVTVREIVPIAESSLSSPTDSLLVDKDNNNKKNSHVRYDYFRPKAKKDESTNNEAIDENHHGQPVPWATVWNGPQRVIFGHDARRGFQRYEGDWAIGLDTGACYGKQLTGIILPEKKIVSVDAVDEHCPIVSKQGTKNRL